MSKLYPVFALLLSACVTVNVTDDSASPSQKNQPIDFSDLDVADNQASPSSNMATDTQVTINDLKVGSGAQAEEGSQVTVHYTGTLSNGDIFDSSLDRDEPFTFTLGSGQVIQGWEQGLIGMKVGGRRKLTIPPELGYGATGAPPSIPPNATLVFEVELLKVN